MTTQPKNKALSREDAAELYEDLRNALAQAKAGGGKAPKAGGSGNPAAKAIAAEISKAMSGSTKKENPTRAVAPRSMPSMPTSYDEPMTPARNRGPAAAVGLVLLFGLARVSLGALEAVGVMGVQTAHATVMTPMVSVQPYGKEEIKVLTALDGRRTELTEKGRQLDGREKQLDIRDREFAVRVAQLKELTDQLKSAHDQDDKKRNSQIEQLANVYSSMSAQEAAQLMEQLDVQISLALIEKMPEKKIGQILALMNKERALTLTKLLSGKIQA